MPIIYQAEDSVEWAYDTMMEQFGNMGNYNVRDGCAVTYSGANMTATIAAGNITHNGATVAVAGGNVTLEADGSNPRWTWIAIDSSGSGVVVPGTAASDPAIPELGDYVAVALVKVEAGQTIANNIATKLDKRIPAGWITSASTGSVRKSADESVTNSATLQNDNELVLDIGANETKIYELFLAYVGGTPGDIKAAFTYPAGANLFRSILTYDNGAYAQNASVASGGSASASALGTTVATLWYERGVIMNGATAGQFQLQWAQLTSNGTATTVKAGSVLRFL